MSEQIQLTYSQKKSSWCSNQETQVIAEYVENSKIQNIIENMGITFSQGYYFSKPKPWKEYQLLTK